MRTLLLAALLTVVPAVAEGPMLSFGATTANVGGAPDGIRIDLLRWSTDSEREKLMAAWNMAAAPAAPGRGGRGAGRGSAPVGDAMPDPDALPAPRRAPVSSAAPATPEARLAAALKQAPTVGYLWSSEVAGYALRYAGKAPGADGGERIILITDRRLGKTNDAWTPEGAEKASERDFSVIELRVNAKGQGEGRISLTGKVAPDSALRTIAAENYEALPVVLKDVRHRTETAAGK